MQKKKKKCVSQKLCLQPPKRRKLPAEELQNPDVNCDMFFVGIKNDFGITLGWYVTIIPNYC